MDTLHKGWFSEFSPDDLEKMKNGNFDDSKLLTSDGQKMGGAWPGQCFSLKVDKVLFHEKSLYQDVLVFKSETYGNVLVLDGIIQCTERDEFSYQEMLCHLPMFAHSNPEKVLIIGGGDGGILREVLKHDCVKEVTMCEIDQMVIDVSKKYLPHMSCQFDNPKLKLFVGDGFEFLAGHKNEFDVIITDSSDPIGPAESLFGQGYYSLLNDALRDGGVLSSQGECPWLDLLLVTDLTVICKKLFNQVRYAIGSVPTYTSGECFWLHLDLIKHLLKFNKTIYPSVAYASHFVSTYPSGNMGYLLCCKSDRDLSIPARTITDEECDKMGLKFYNSEIHKAAFVLPQFVKKALKGI
uniref:Spermidine synthase n=1 Tax=Strongyloides stercoralis TaxID=6248 RepID=A0A913I620_STRER